MPELEADPEPEPEPEAEPEPEPEPEPEVDSEPEPEPSPEDPAQPVVTDTSEGEMVWFVQVASFGSADTADEIGQRLDDLGHIARIDELVRGQTTLHRVRTGPYGSAEDAERARGQINRTIAGIEPVVRQERVDEDQAPGEDAGFSVQVGSFASRNNADRLKSQLDEAGFEAVIHEDSGGNRTIWRVRAGRVADREAAEALREQIIESMGLEGLVVSLP